MFAGINGETMIQTQKTVADLRLRRWVERGDGIEFPYQLQNLMLLLAEARFPAVRPLDPAALA